ncbi:hypothetical protein [Halobellus sp. GM3]|uniref:hypothetical protein n=1 Tax=Halobellus sp. GM3 TaxID=3458410 RepID=UPI00403E1298
MTPPPSSDDRPAAGSRSRQEGVGSETPPERGRSAAVVKLLVRGERTNAVIGWGLLLVAGYVAVDMVRDGSVLWGAFAALIAITAATPAGATRDWSAMVPWPLVALVTAAVLTRRVGLYPDIAGYAAVSGLALVVVVEMEATTLVEMSRSFAVFFAVLTTMALQTWWTVAQFYSDRWFDTQFLTTQTELQWDFVAVTVVAVLAGGFFQWYLEQFDHVGTHRHPIVPDDS